MALAKGDTPLAKIAAKVLKRYSYPVDNMIFTSDGGYVNHFPANGSGFGKERDERFLRYLRSSLRGGERKER